MDRSTTIIVLSITAAAIGILFFVSKKMNEGYVAPLPEGPPKSIGEYQGEVNGIKIYKLPGGELLAWTGNNSGHIALVR
jgi:hypothetical protein